MAASSHLGAGIGKPPWDSISVPEIRQLADQLCKSLCLHNSKPIANKRRVAFLKQRWSRGPGRPSIEPLPSPFERVIVWPDGRREIEGVTPKQLPAPASHTLPNSLLQTAY